MNWVSPIKDEKTLRQYEEELLRQDVKYFIMFRIGVGTGMQVQDILKLTVGDVRDKDLITVYLGTHRIKRSYRFDPDLKKVIQEYTEGKEDNDPLFRGMKQNPVSREQAYRALKTAGTRIGLGTIGAQTMRKTFAWNYYRKTGDIYYLTNLLNHASPSVTFRFIGEKPKVDLIAARMTPEENMRSRRKLFQDRAGISRMEAVKDMMNHLEKEMDNPMNNDAFYGRLDALLSGMEELMRDFRADSED